MIEVLGLHQQSKEWVNWRDGGIGGSEAPIIYRGDVFGKTPYGLWMKKMGLIQTVQFTSVQQAHLDRGHALEPQAREEFISRTGIQIEPLCAQSSKHPFMFASLDGINAARDIIVEIKAPAEEMFKKTLEGGIPDYYYDQVQHQIEVVNAREAYYCAFNPEVKPYFYIERILPDYARIQDLIRKESIFWTHVETGVPPWSDLGLDKAQIGMLGLTMFCGYARTGKDTFGGIHQTMFKTKRYAFADPLKEMYCKLERISLARLAKEKEKHRDGLVALGHGMRGVAGNVWVDGVFNMNSGIYGDMTKIGAIVTDCRYINEASAGRKHAARLGVPCRVIWIERPGVGPANEQEEKATSLLRAVSDVILVNDLDITRQDDRSYMECALINAMSVVPDGKQQTFSASSYKPEILKRRKKDATKPKKASRNTRKAVRR